MLPRNAYSNTSLQFTMAPSRAILIRRIASAYVQPQIRIHASARLLSTSAPVVRPQYIRAIPIPRLPPTFTTSRSYSAQADGAPEPPDFLNEAELHIFNKIKGELDPVKLEVRERNCLGGGLKVSMNGVCEIVETHVIYHEVRRDQPVRLCRTRDA